MAEEKTEQPTPKKLRDAREKGQVAKSTELVSAILIIMMFAVLYIFGGMITSEIMDFILLPAQYIQVPFDEALSNVIESTFFYLVLVMVPITVTGIVTAVLANFLQIGAVFSGDSLTPKLEKISPIAGFKRIFSMRNLMEFVKSIIKLLVIITACIYVIRSNLDDLLQMPACGEECILAYLGHLMLQLALYSSAAFLLLAIADVIYQRYEHSKGLKMTKDEIKREYKDTEGNPEIKGRRKSIHREITTSDDTPRQVVKSSVVVSNPTHIAVAIAYDGRKYKVPQIMAMGTDLSAKRIKEIAKLAHVPVMENVPLARALFAQGEIGGPIPRHLFKAVAEVLRAVKQIQREAAGLSPDQPRGDTPSDS